MVKIIAEIGSNWRDLNDCLHSIAMAKAAGADAVKFQAYTPMALYGRNCCTMNERLPLTWLPALKEKADQCGIEFMCSAFSPELIDEVDPYVRIHKVASAELTHVRMLEKLRAIGKPVILSTGASGEYDIDMALKTLGETPVTLLYCVAAYPARAVELETIRLLGERFKKPVGYSDHTTDYLTIPRLAVQMGACVIEKHMTDIPEVDTPDRPHSLTVDEFKRMVEAIRGTRKASIGYTPEENDMVLKHNRRLVATRDIQPGETIEENRNFGIYRSLKADPHGMSPWAIGHVHGKVATRAIQAGHGIGPEDIG